MAFTDSGVIAAIGAHIRGKTPPSGQTVRIVYDYPPESLGAVPAVVLFPGSDTQRFNGGGRIITLNVTATLYLPAVEYARQYATIATFRTWMRDLLIDAVLLNSEDGVAQASVTGTTVDSTDYADATFITVSANMEIVGAESISPSA